MANTFKPKRSYTSSNTPTLAAGEYGINAADGKAWIGNAAGTANILVSSLARSDHTGTLAVASGGTGVTTSTGSGSVVLSTSPTLTTPAIGVATATTINKVTITAPATGATVTIADGKTMTVSNTLTFTGTDSSSVAFGTGGSVLYSGGALGTPSSGTLTNCTFPTLNQNTTGSSASCTGNAATSTKTTNIIGGNSTTLLGSMPYQSNTDTTTFLSPNTTTTKKYLAQTGTGTNGAAPAWSQPAVTEISASTAGGAVYSTASALAVTAAGTSGQVLTSAGASAPTWSNVLPSGVMQMYGGAITQSVSAGTLTTTAPSGWALCDGSAISRTTYSALFTAIGTTYGTGDGSTTFNLPDLRGRFGMGAGTGSGLNSSGTGAISGTAQTARSIGQWGGEETHLLTTSEMPSHSHTLTTYAASSGASGYRLYDRYGDATNVIGTTTAGGDARHATIPPFVVLNYIIKT